MKSWEIFHLARKALKNEMYTVFGNRSSRMIDYWAQDPAFSAESKRNPIDRLAMLLHRLDQGGMRSVAVSALRILASTINMRVAEPDAAVADKETLFEEIIDDLPCLVAFHDALQGDDLVEVDRTMAELHRELAESRHKFIEVRGIDDPARVTRPPG